MIVLCLGIAVLLSPDREADSRALNRVVTLYRRYGLPLPPSEAPLVKISGGMGSWGYLLKGTLESKETIPIWVGTAPVQYPKRDGYVKVDPMLANY